jgi:hypothetical protein
VTAGLARDQQKWELLLRPSARQLINLKPNLQKRFSLSFNHIFSRDVP